MKGWRSGFYGFCRLLMKQEMDQHGTLHGWLETSGGRRNTEYVCPFMCVRPPSTDPSCIISFMAGSALLWAFMKQLFESWPIMHYYNVNKVLHREFYFNLKSPSETCQ